MPKQTVLYTRQGDEGYTRLLGKDRIPKYDLRPEAYGTVDEAGSFMGLVRAEPAASERTRQLILASQRDLWILMGELAAAPGVELPRRLAADRTAWLEAETDRLGAETPPLTQFVIPGDTIISARLEVARAVVRRAERRVAHLAHANLLDNNEILRYLNRLSSLLFALARYEEHLAGQKTTLAKEVE
ncbi:MAG: cob(I)yrinic acid a,c-diamide adenosyltransferase [Chloroflexota bacterium]